MSITSENIQRLKKVDLIVRGYDWTCLNCGHVNKEPVECIIVNCTDCGTIYRVNQVYEG